MSVFTTIFILEKKTKTNKKNPSFYSARVFPACPFCLPPSLLSCHFQLHEAVELSSLLMEMTASTKSSALSPADSLLNTGQFTQPLFHYVVVC